MNPHKLYLSLFTVLCIVVLIVGSAWRDHVRDDARRDAVIETQKSDIAQIEQRIAAAQNDAASRIAELERERKQLFVQPARAPEVIRELIPTQAPFQPSGNLAKAPPDAPGATLTHNQQVDLAQYALGCKECTIERDQLQQQTKDQQEIISRQNVELDAAKKSAKGGSVWQRAKRIARWGAIFGATGYVIGRTQR
ncbi:MAG TPA: hypothetical protein VJT08_16905 [Terriglobales bacterium]|nr:hypothetical protein [Terriglobales bacterium]